MTVSLLGKTLVDCKNLGCLYTSMLCEQAKVQRLKDQAADPHDIKYAVRGEANRRHTDLILQAGGVWGVASGSHVVLRRAGNTPPPLPQENILAESAAMLPDTRQRLEEAYRELQGLAVRPSRWCPTLMFGLLGC